MRAPYGRMPGTPGNFFRDLPLTKLILLLWVLSFLLVILTSRPGQPSPLFFWLRFDPQVVPQLFTGLVTYPLLIGIDIFSLLLTGLVFFWFGGSLERSWGWRRLLLFLLIANAAAALVWEAGVLLLARSPVPVAGPWFMLSSVVVAWAWLNPEETILLWFVLPLKAKWIGWLDILLLYFGMPIALGMLGPVMFILGFFALGGVAVAFLYARWQRQSGWIPRQPRPQSSRTRGPILHPNSTLIGRLLVPYREWKRRKNVSKLRKSIKWDD